MKKGFTLMEVIVSLGLTSLILGISLTFYGAAIKSYQNEKCEDVAIGVAAFITKTTCYCIENNVDGTLLIDRNEMSFNSQGATCIFKYDLPEDFSLSASSYIIYIYHDKQAMLTSSTIRIRYKGKICKTLTLPVPIGLPNIK